MSALKTLAIGVALGIATQTMVRADAVSSSTTWVYYGSSNGTVAYTLRNQYPSVFSTRTLSGFAQPASASPTSSVAAPSVSAGERTASTAAVTTAAVSTPTSTAPVDAYINLGTSTAPEASQLTTGGGQPWYDSPAVTKVYGGGVPNASQQASFSSMVLNDVKQTFSESGLNPTLTLDPNVAANHTLSVVSNTSYPLNANAIGITDVGHSGFSFIDKLNYASTPEELATAVSKNISHELMHAFGVGSHPDTTGNYIDTATASWSLLTNPSSTFSPDAIALISKTGFGNEASGISGAQLIDGEQDIAAVPEPTTWAIWSIGGLLGIVAERRRKCQ